MGIVYNTSTVKSGLVLHLDAASVKSYPGSGTTWNDLSGNAYNATLVDGPTSSANSIVFNGNDDRVHVPSPSDRFAWTPTGPGLNTMTIEVWVKSVDTDGNFVSKPWNSSGEYNYRILPTSLSVVVGAQSATMTFSSISTGNWEHLCIVVNSTQFAAYRNGTLNTAFTSHGITANSPVLTNNNHELCLMSLFPYAPGWPGQTSFSTQGELANLKIYNKVLSASEVAQNFSALRGRFGI